MSSVLIVKYCTYKGREGLLYKSRILYFCTKAENKGLCITSLSNKDRIYSNMYEWKKLSLSFVLFLLRLQLVN